MYYQLMLLKESVSMSKTAIHRYMNYLLFHYWMLLCLYKKI